MNDMVQPQPQTAGKPHDLTATGRRDITVHGVTDVVSFDEANIRLVTTCGILNLEGEELRIHVLNTKEGTVLVTGKLNGLLYEDADPRPEPAPRSARPRGRLFGR